MEPASPPLVDQYLQFCAENGYCVTENQNAKPQSSTLSPELQEQIDTIYTVMQSIDNHQLRPYFGFAGAYLSCTTQCIDIKIALFATNLLLNNGINVNDKVNAKHTALEQVLEFEERLPVIELLLQRGASVPKNLSLKGASQTNLEAALKELRD